MQHQDCIFSYLLVINTEKSTITELINAKAMNELYHRWQKFHLISWSVSRSIPANVYLNSAVQWMMLTHILVFDKLQGGALNHIVNKMTAFVAQNTPLQNVRFDRFLN